MYIKKTIKEHHAYTTMYLFETKVHNVSLVLFVTVDT